MLERRIRFFNLRLCVARTDRGRVMTNILTLSVKKWLKRKYPGRSWNIVRHAAPLIYISFANVLSANLRKTRDLKLFDSEYGNSPVRCLLTQEFTARRHVTPPTSANHPPQFFGQLKAGACGQATGTDHLSTHNDTIYWLVLDSTTLFYLFNQSVMLLLKRLLMRANTHTHTHTCTFFRGIMTVDFVCACADLNIVCYVCLFIIQSRLTLRKNINSLSIAWHKLFLFCMV